MNLQITRDEAALLTDALAKAASRHESQARAVKYGRKHDLAAKAMRVLRSRLYEVEMQKQQEALAKERKAMVGTGDRSEKIRTYNFPQNRVTDHRIGLTIHQLQEVMDGKLQPVVDALITHYQAEKLKQETTAAV